MSWEVHFDTGELEELAKVSNGIGRTLEKGHRRYLVALSRHINKSLPRRSGLLAKAWLIRGGDQGAVLESSHTKDSATALLGSRLVYAAIQNEGGVIRPRKAKKLTVPLRAAKTAAGVHRYKSARSVPGLFVLKKGSSLLLVKRESNGSITPYYALVDEVKIDGKFYLEEALEAVDPQPIYDAVIRERIERAA